MRRCAGTAYSRTDPAGFTSTQRTPSIPTATAADAGTYTLTVRVGECSSAPGPTAVQECVTSNDESQHLVGNPASGLPTIVTIGGAGISPVDPTIPGAHVETVVGAGSTVTITGTGFAGPLVNLSTAVGNIGPLTPQAGGVVNLGGLNPDGTAVIPLTILDAQHFTFELPAGAQPGPAYVHALNPPYTPFTSTGTDPGGAFTVP